MTHVWCACAFGRFLERGVLKIALALVLMGGAVVTAHAQKIAPGEGKRVQEQPVPYEPAYEVWRDCGLRKGDVNAFVSRRPSRSQTKTKQATITVNYGSGFPDQAVEAYERAVDIWESHIDSEVEIRIDADRIPDPDPRALGGTIPNQFWVLEAEGGGDTVIAGDALADVLVGEDLAPDSVDLLTDFNFDRNDWHFGEGEAPSGQIDFTTVALHEIAHGLHYLSLCRHDQGRCNLELSDGSTAPGIYSEFIRERQSDGSLTTITNQREYSTPESIREGLTSDRLVFDGDGANTLAARSTGPVPPKIYAPSEYNQGSSISHLDEDTYSFEGVNALMTPRVAPAETNRQPGPIVCGQLFDLGWPMGEGCFSEFPGVFGLQEAEADAQPNQITLDWRVRDGAQVDQYVIEKKYFDGPFRDEVVVGAAEAPPVTVGPLGLGQFTFRVRWRRTDGTEQVTVQQVSKTVSLQDGQVDVASKDEQGRATVNASWAVPAESGDFRYVLDRREGSTGPFAAVATNDRPEFSVDGQIPGRYEYRVRAIDADGNEVVSAVEPVEVDFQGEVYLSGPFPNPARNRAVIELTARTAQNVSVSVHNSLGERVYREERELQSKSPVRLSLESRRWSSGVYFLRVKGSEFTKTRKMVVVK